MASLDFPASPNDQDTYLANNVTYTFNATKGIWEAAGGSTGGGGGTATAVEIQFTANVTGSPTELYSFETSSYRGAKVIVTFTEDPNYKIQELLVLHNDANVSISEPYLTDNEVNFGNIDVSLTANISGGNVNLFATANSGSPVAKGEINLISK